MITIKEYASQRGVSAQSVHQKIKRNQKELGEHIHVEKGVKYLDDVAINILEGTTEHQKSQKQAKQTLISPDVKKELDELREENARLRKALEYSELRNEALNEVLKIGREQYGIDLLKKAGAKQ